jgi:hypothetical protein
MTPKLTHEDLGKARAVNPGIRAFQAALGSDGKITFVPL